MTPRSRRTALVVALSILAATGAVPANAQPYEGGGQGPDLGRLHDDLRLDAAQESAWRAFQSSSQPDPDQQARQRGAQQMMPRLNGPQRVDLSIAVAQADLDTLRRRGAALKAFYAQLSPAQQATFDRETVPQPVRDPDDGD